MIGHDENYNGFDNGGGVLVFGQSTPTDANVNIMLTGTAGILFYYSDADRGDAGHYSRAAGDFNGDGRPDFVFGAPDNYPGNSTAYIVFVSSTITTVSTKSKTVPARALVVHLAASALAFVVVPLLFPSLSPSFLLKTCASPHLKGIEFVIDDVSRDPLKAQCATTLIKLQLTWNGDYEVKYNPCRTTQYRGSAMVSFVRTE